MENYVILLSSSDDEDERLREAKKRKCMDGVRSAKGIHVRCFDDEFKVLSDLSGFKNLAAMMEAEAFMRRRKRRRRRKKKNKGDAEKKGEQVDTVKVVETTEVVETETILISENDMPQKLVVDGAKEEKPAETFKDVKTTKAFEAGDGVRSAIVIDLCLSSVEEDEVVADLSSSRGVGEMVPAEPIVRNKRKENKEKSNEAQAEIVDAMKEGKQPGKVKAMETTKALEPKSVQITENIVPQSLVVDAAKEEEQADKFKDVETTKEFDVGDGIRSAVVIDLCLLSSDEDEVIADLSRSRGVEEILLAEPIIDVTKEGEQPNTVEAIETTKALEIESIPTTELIMPRKLFEEKQVDTGKGIETVVSNGTETVEIKGNIVLRKLLRGPRYFDPPKGSWGMCCYCGEESHSSVNCTAKKRKKPCFVCGGLEHGGNHCKQGRVCYFCQGMGHIAKDCPEKHQKHIAEDCPEKHQNTLLSSNICLRCGDSGHDMWSCNGNYSSDNLKEIQCYVCKSFGHLGCFDFPDMGTKQVACYNCGQSGHLGSGCTKSHGNTSSSRSPSLCYRCGQEGHFARGCKKYAKAEKNTGNLSTPRRFPKAKKDFFGSKSAPQDLYKAQKKKESQNKEGESMIAGQSRWRDGCITDAPGNLFYREPRENVWISPSISTKSNQGIPASSAYGHFLSPQYPYQMFNHHPGSPSSQAYQQRFSTPRFGNFSNG